MVWGMRLQSCCFANGFCGFSTRTLASWSLWVEYPVDLVWPVYFRLWTWNLWDFDRHFQRLPAWLSGRVWGRLGAHSEGRRFLLSILWIYSQIRCKSSKFPWKLTRAPSCPFHSVSPIWPVWREMRLKISQLKEIFVPCPITYRAGFETGNRRWTLRKVFCWCSVQSFEPPDSYWKDSGVWARTASNRTKSALPLLPLWVK